MEFIKKGSFVFEYVGENLTHHDSSNRENARKDGDIGSFIFEDNIKSNDSNIVIDATRYFYSHIT